MRWVDLQYYLLDNPKAGERLKDAGATPPAEGGEPPKERSQRKYEDPESPLQIVYQFDEENDAIVFLDIVARHISVTRVVFISYSHKDKDWQESIYSFALEVLEDAGDIEFWRDDDIKAGQKWSDKIEDRLRSATGALLLVSDSFLDSEFIRTRELPVILGDGDGKEGVLWILVKRVAEGRESDADWMTLKEIQAVGDPQVPLEDLGQPGVPTAELFQAFVNIQKEVSAALRKRSAAD